ncbi:hypothetical protein PDESU_03527 [Pontiella desulfatans]|uniref:NADPH-dependent FMN reductase-like domain-containing protein n=1 Tax=Pontiella desulfatans TaxID=2750659 RepID=A0A6C2U559_PONDE|nr:NAD(P)H-dependent oxidoreductase [Pontiella desulfatans]VGO14947.1 hypothetical protein PDESU_03527 [Pontiella desulfatans]
MVKERPTPWQVMESLADIVSKAYGEKRAKATGTIQFVLSHADGLLECHLVADGGNVRLCEGRADRPEVTLCSSFYDWLDLAGGRLHPVLGVIRGKLKFSGKTSLFAALMPDDAFWETVDNRVQDPPTPFEMNPVRHWKKPQKVVVLNGSPRGEGGYTEFYLRAFLAGLGRKGVGIETIHLRELDIRQCSGCWQCWLKGTGECVFQDDFQRVRDRVWQADLVVFAFPLYVDGMPSLLKNLLDRSVGSSSPFMVEGIWKTRHPRRVARDQACVVLSICGFLEMDNFDAVKAHVRQVSHNLHLPVVAGIYRSAAMYLHGNPTVYRQLNEVLDAMARAGAEIVEKGLVRRKTMRRIEQQPCTPKVFRKESNFYWTHKVGSGDADY